jgi:hypothetical protein
MNGTGDRVLRMAWREMVGRPPSPALAPQTEGGKGDATRGLSGARLKFNLPQGFLGEVGEVYEPGGGAAGALESQQEARSNSPLSARNERGGAGGGAPRNRSGPLAGIYRPGARRPPVQRPIAAETDHHQPRSRAMRRTFVILPALALLAACDGGGGSRSNPLTPQEVSGVYNLCTLRFQPSNGALPAANLLTTVVDTTPPGGRPEATVALAANGTYDLAYTEASTAFIQQIRGSIGYREDQISLTFPQSSASAAALLLPRTLLLGYNASTRQLTGDQSGFPYPVTRADYASAAGISQEGLQPTINGNAQVVFSEGACP